jgi:hypothetical protein
MCLWTRRDAQYLVLHHTKNSRHLKIRSSPKLTFFLVAKSFHRHNAI